MMMVMMMPFTQCLLLRVGIIRLIGKLLRIDAIGLQGLADRSADGGENVRRAGRGAQVIDGGSDRRLDLAAQSLKADVDEVVEEVVEPAAEADWVEFELLLELVGSTAVLDSAINRN